MKKILVIFGTRPEAIKLAPVIRALKESQWAEVKVCVTAQHRQMLDQVLEIFNIKPEYDLNIMTANQDLCDVTCNVLLKLRELLCQESPDLILVQGDTTTAFAASLIAYYKNVKLGHVEAGLRTKDKRNPFPEEINRRLTSVLVDIHFAPTVRAKNALLYEAIPEERIFVTGNTVVDALFWALEVIEKNKTDDILKIQNWAKEFAGNKRIVLITAHRRESFGKPFEAMCQAIFTLAQKFSEVHWIYPVHLNPNVRKPVFEILGNSENIHLIEPLDYLSFIWLMNRSHLILTDSGGIQEEAPSLGKPVLVMRETTERPEGIDAGTTRLVGTHTNAIVDGTTELMTNNEVYDKMTRAINPYGDGKAAGRIVTACEQFLYGPNNRV